VLDTLLGPEGSGLVPGDLGAGAARLTGVWWWPVWDPCFGGPRHDCQLAFGCGGGGGVGAGCVGVVPPVC
jgi:hypothetical protein